MVTSKTPYVIRLNHTVICLLVVFSIELIFTTKLEAQVIGIEETIQFINKKLEGYCELEKKKKHIEVNFFKGGETYRTDYLHTDELNYETVNYSEDEKGIIIECRESAGKCIQRKIPHLKIIDNYERVLFLYEGSEKEISALKEAFIHLIKLAYFSDMNRTEPFE